MRIKGQRPLFLRPNKPFIKNSGSSILYNWRCSFNEPVQDDIARDGTEYYWYGNMDGSSNLENYAGTKLLTKGGAGTPVASTFYFNNNGIAINYDGTSYHAAAGIMDADLGLQDMYIECDFSFTGKEDTIYGICCVGNATNGWSVFLYGTSVYLRMYNSGGSKTMTKVIGASTNYLRDGTRHRLKIECDRSESSNRKIYIDGIELTADADTIGDYSATSITGTSFGIGCRITDGTSPWLGEISQLKVVYGSYTGSTTSTFQTSLAADYGTTAAALTRTTYQTGRFIGRNKNGMYIARNLAGNPATQGYDSATLLEHGILLETSATNYCTYSQAFDNAAWAKNGTPPTVTANSVAAPDGTLSADTLAAGANNDNLTQDSGENSASQTYIFSCYIRMAAGTADKTDVVLELEDNAAGAEKATALLDADTGADGTITTSWKRFYVKTTFSAGVGGKARSRIKVLDATIGNIYIWGAQLENSTAYPSRPSSYIESIGATSTRNFTSLAIPAAKLSNNCTVLMMYQPYFSSTDMAAISSFLGITTAASALNLYFAVNSNLQFTYFGTLKDYGAQTWSAYDWVCCGAAWNTSTDKYYGIWDATRLDEQTTAKADQTYNSAILGYNIGTYGPNGTIAEVRIYPKVLSQAEITSEYNDMVTRLGI